LAGLWTSRLEYEVAALVDLSTGLEVRVGNRRARVDRRSTEHIDLLVVEADLLCDLDPTRWHRAEGAIIRDSRKLERFAGQRYVRIRPQQLGRLTTDRAEWNQQVLLHGDDESDPWLWASSVIRALRTYLPELEVRSPSPEDRASALTEADRRWRQLRAGSRARSLLSEFPVVAAQLVQVVDRPDLTAADIAPSGDERAIWRCPDCRHEWEARVANRTVLRTGCPPCSYRRGGAQGARPAAGKSFADHHPELVRYFRRDETHPGLTLFDLKPNSTDLCWWTCPHCSRDWKARPHALHRNPGAGCGACGPQRAVRSRAKRQHAKQTAVRGADQRKPMRALP
jgi:ssDNA-binding Zn-finger/Zn-ribbon topoisomerase 1